jgi:hypothetical protein
MCLGRQYRISELVGQPLSRADFRLEILDCRLQIVESIEHRAWSMEFQQAACSMQPAAGRECGFVKNLIGLFYLFCWAAVLFSTSFSRA